MTALFFLLICLFLGFFFKRTGFFPQNTPSALNAFIIHVALPALVLLHLKKMNWELSHLLSSLMPWFFFVVAAIFFMGMGKLFHWPQKTIACLILVGGLGNTSFVGFPMVEAFYGKEALGVAVLVDQLGSFLVVVTLGFWMIALISASRENLWSGICKRVLLFTPFYAFILALILKPVPFPLWLESFLSRLGDTLVPLALFSVGFQINLRYRKERGSLVSGLLFKLLLGPALVAFVLLFFLDRRDLVYQVTTLEAAMPPMITGGILASENDLDPPLANLTVGLGIILSFITVPLWNWFLQL